MRFSKLSLENLKTQKIRQYAIKKKENSPFEPLINLTCQQYCCCYIIVTFVSTHNKFLNFPIIRPSSQVEVNPGQIGGPGSATQVAKLHAKMLDKLEILQGRKLPVLAKAQMPKNRPRHEIAQTIYEAW